MRRPMPSTESESDFYDQLERALEILAASGIWRSNYAPPAYRALWRFGARVRPPHFNAFVTNFLVTGCAFGTLWFVVMWLLIWRPTGIPISVGLMHAAVAGLFFGVAMAGYYAFSARRHKLPAWSDVLNQKSVFD